MNKLEFLLRWTHVFAGIIWIGHLYFFNFVNLQLQPAMDDATKKLVNPHLMPRALWWFRWGAMVTFLSGLVMFGLIYMYTPEIGWGSNMLLKGDAGLTDRARWIMWGMLFGSIMWFNVWFVIWPAQKKLLGGTAGDAAPALRTRAALASKINTFLSAPMLVGMLGANHANMGFSYGLLLLAVLLGLAAIKVAYVHSTFVGKTV
ncbi:MAG: urate hydroxylase PuuD [Elusimicrobiota bacterium]|nr:MAG: urate hydroxylase PuuD [Elusimicrobiota bacterium]